MLGEALYPLIHEYVSPLQYDRLLTRRTQPDLAGKITGMLLEMEVSDLLNLLDTPAALTEKVDEALSVLAAWGKQSEAQGEEAKVEVKEEAKAE